MKHFLCFLILLMVVSIASKASCQCDPDKQFFGSASIEAVSDWGIIIQGGITGQINPISLHVGLRTRSFVDSSTKKLGQLEPKYLPRLEFDLRIVDGIHIGTGISKDPDVYTTVYKRIGNQTAMFGRALYDGSLRFGLGIKCIFYKQ